PQLENRLTLNTGHFRGAGQGDWGISSNASIIRSPISADAAEVQYVRYDPALQSDDPAFYQTEEYVTITATKSAEGVQAFELMYANEGLRAAVFTAGPYNYPIMMQTQGTVVGDVSIGVISTNQEVANAYLTRMIGCAIKSGMIAAEVDPASLDPVP
ncbi:MAG: hypothetical protein AAGF56_07675, partial [Pseudomonadota bacterium]